MSDLVYIPSPSGDDAGYMSLSKTPQGRLIRKQILPMNSSFVHPANKQAKIFVDKKMAQSLVDNFNKGYSIVQVPVVNDNNQHVEDPLRNAGEVIDLDYDDTGVYATIDARKFSEDFGKTILGASAFMHLNYEDTKTGAKVGPTLLHVAATNRPYINGLSDYTDIIKASADIKDEEDISYMLADNSISLSNTDKDGQMTYEEWLAAGKADFSTDVEALKAQAERATELSAQLDSANEQIKLSAGEGGNLDVAGLADAFVKLTASNEALEAKVAAQEAKNEELALSAATNEVEGLIKSGRLLPKQKESMIALSLANREMFDSLVPDTAVVQLSEHGLTLHEVNDNSKFSSDIERYKGMIRGSSKTKN